MVEPDFYVVEDALFTDAIHHNKRPYFVVENGNDGVVSDKRKPAILLENLKEHDEQVRAEFLAELVKGFERK